MMFLKARRLIGVTLVATAILGGAAACSAETDSDAVTKCLDLAGISYEVKDGSVVVTQYESEGTEKDREATRVCVELATSG